MEVGRIRKKRKATFCTLRLILPISYLGACYIRTKVTQCIRDKMTLHFRVCEPLNDIHQDTKSQLQSFAKSRAL